MPGLPIQGGFAGSGNGLPHRCDGQIGKAVHPRLEQRTAGQGRIWLHQRGTGMGVAQRNDQVGILHRQRFQEMSLEPPECLQRSPPTEIGIQIDQPRPILQGLQSHHREPQGPVHRLRHVMPRRAPVAGIDADGRGDVSPGNADPAIKGIVRGLQ